MTIFSESTAWEEFEDEAWAIASEPAAAALPAQITVPENTRARLKMPCARTRPRTVPKDWMFPNARGRPVTKGQWPATDDTAGNLCPTVAAQNALDQVVCFTPGTRILTAQGDRAIDTLQVGDLVVTRDQGLRPIRWIGHRTVRGRGVYAPVLFKSGPGHEETGVLVSPHHRMLFSGGMVHMLFGTSEVLIAAKDLVDGRYVVHQPVDEISYIHLMFDHHEVIYADGVASESFHATDAALTGLDDAAREAVFDEFPELRTAPGRHLEPARRCLDDKDAGTLSGRISEM